MKAIEREIIEFSILKELSYNGNMPSYQNYNIDEDCFVSLFKDMINKNYINPKRVLFNILGKVEIDNEFDLVTTFGNNFIEMHEGWNKLYKNLNDIDKLLDKVIKND